MFYHIHHADESDDKWKPTDKYCDCKIMSIRKQVKSGKNKGRLFYSCSKFGTSMHDERCDFFSWEEPRIFKTPLKYSRRKKSPTGLFQEKSKENNYPTTPSQSLPTKTLPQLWNSNKTTRRLNTSILIDKKSEQVQQSDERIQDSLNNNHNDKIWNYIKTLEKKVDENKEELDKIKLELNDLKSSNEMLKKKLQDEEERNFSLVKSFRRQK